ncbi:glucose-1-phosphate thymidylyltransferase RfbA [Succinivibrio dextrinosolvens]|uniref:glucose-1-phosphate thymidylyltransferase RfbA n=1 Tax=Succinivibrio dextrinosolvens TaxID=83771 RepID=UPI00241E04C5|nr:glucose-1-phosphate thymidylyltransferase RfbA [Succinivibrio dextrinosolvens]MBE6423008.1 glucose-1-phosphate thymidylyltransferase RfbA [Succinivibrio dextrinosolvens]
MKGILLAGGSGTRLYPLTKTMSKQLLPVYDKPMIYYPLSTLMLFGIKDILIISTPRDIPNIENLLGDGHKLGLNLNYKIQEEPNGIAQAFILGEEFLNDPKEDVCLILGDNIFYMGTQFGEFSEQVKANQGKNATIFAFHVNDPERFGVVEFDENYKALSIEEKPSKPKSNYASIGLYFYPGDVVSKAKTLKPSARGEYEITDLNNMYLKENRLSVVPMRRGNAWLDAGTPDSLMDSGNFVQIIEQRQGLKIACLEEIAYNMGYIDDKQMQSLIDELKKGKYKDYLIKVLKEKHELY